MGTLGLDPFAFLESKDPFERAVMVKLADKMMETKQIMDRNLAAEIANAVGKLFKK